MCIMFNFSSTSLKFIDSVFQIRHLVNASKCWNFYRPLIFAYKYWYQILKISIHASVCKRIWLLVRLCILVLTPIKMYSFWFVYYPCQHIATVRLKILLLRNSFKGINKCICCPMCLNFISRYIFLANSTPLAANRSLKL